MSQQNKKNDPNQNKPQITKHNDNAVAAICMLVLMIILVVTSLFSTSHPLDFIVNALSTITLYIFMFVLFASIIGVVYYYVKIGRPDPDQSFGEATQENIEYTKYVAEDISEKLQAFYAEYKRRVREAEQHKNNE